MQSHKMTDGELLARLRLTLPPDSLGAIYINRLSRERQERGYLTPKQSLALKRLYERTDAGKYFIKS